ncbi:MAG: TolC family protein, partial [Acidobacteria bacterium]|nr:TolC family protein [Acidobacteriota bacterium]
LYETTEDLLLSGGRAHRLDAAVLAAEGWLELAAQTEHVVLVEERVRRLERALEVQSRRYELGEISGSERRQLELEGVRERASLDLAESRLLVARQQLESLAPGGVFPPAAGDLYRLLEALGAALPSEADLDSLLSESPYLRLAAHHRAVAAAEEKVLARNVWGSPEVELEWEHIPGLDGAAGLDAAGFRIGWPLPLGAQGRQRLAAAQQRVSAEAARSELLRRELGARLRSHWSTIRLGRAGLGGLEEAAAQIPETEHSLAEQFRLGAISYVVFLDGLARLDELRQGLIETRHRVLAAQLEMARLLGAEEFFPLPLEKGAGS